MEPLVRPPEIDPTEFFRFIGKALVAVQVLEYGLCHYLAIWGHESPEQARALLEDSLKKTFGQLLKALGKHGLVPDGFDDRLERFRNERNWLVHRLYAEDWYDLYRPGKAEAMRMRVQAVHAESKVLQKVFTNLNEQWCLANGLTPEELDRAYMKVFEHVMGAQQSPL